MAYTVRATFFRLQEYKRVAISRLTVCERAGKSVIKDDFQSVLRSLRTLMFVNIINFTRWNADRCYWLLTTCLIFEAFQVLFPASLIFAAAAKLFHQVI